VFIIKQCTAAANPEEDISIGRAAAADGVGVGPDKQMHLERSTMQGVIMFPSFTQYTRARAHYIIYVLNACVRVRLYIYIRRRGEVYASTTAKTVSLSLSVSLPFSHSHRIPFGIYPPLRFVLYFFFIFLLFIYCFFLFFFYVHTYIPYHAVLVVNHTFMLIMCACVCVRESCSRFYLSHTNVWL